MFLPQNWESNAFSFYGMKIIILLQRGSSTQRQLNRRISSGTKLTQKSCGRNPVIRTVSRQKEYGLGEACLNRLLQAVWKLNFCTLWTILLCQDNRSDNFDLWETNPEMCWTCLTNWWVTPTLKCSWTQKTVQLKSQEYNERQITAELTSLKNHVLNSKPQPMPSKSYFTLGIPLLQGLV